MREYWIIDEMEKKVYCLQRSSKTGKFKQTRAQKGALASHVLPGLYLRPKWLWKRPLPKMKEVLRELLESRG